MFADPIISLQATPLYIVLYMFNICIILYVYCTYSVFQKYSMEDLMVYDTSPGAQVYEVCALSSQWCRVHCTTCICLVYMYA